MLSSLAVDTTLARAGTPTRPTSRSKADGAHPDRAIDRDGNLIDTMLSATHDMKAAQRFFRSAQSVVGFVPDRVTTDGHNSYPRAIRSTLGRNVRHRTSVYLNNRLEQDHRGIKGGSNVCAASKSMVRPPVFVASTMNSATSFAADPSQPTRFSHPPPPSISPSRPHGDAHYAVRMISKPLSARRTANGARRNRSGLSTAIFLWFDLDFRSLHGGLSPQNVPIPSRSPARLVCRTAAVRRPERRPGWGQGRNRDDVDHGNGGKLFTADRYWAAAFATPYAAVFLVFVVYPIGYGLWLGSDPASYRALFADPVYPRTVTNTLLYLLFGVNLKLVLAVLLSGFFIRKGWWPKTLLLAFMLPWPYRRCPAI